MKRYLLALALFLALAGRVRCQVQVDNGLQVGPSAHYTVVAWTASVSQNITGYKIYRTQTSGSGYVLVATVSGATLTFTDNQLYAGNTYYYVVTTLAVSMAESPFSNEVTAVVPAP